MRSLSAPRVSPMRLREPTPCNPASSKGPSYVVTALHHVIGVQGGAGQDKPGEGEMGATRWTGGRKAEGKLDKPHLDIY